MIHHNFLSDPAASQTNKQTQRRQIHNFLDKGNDGAQAAGS